MLEEFKKVHLIGIGGIGVSAVARILHARGFEVSGSDVRQSALTDEMVALGMKVTIGHDASNIDALNVRIAAATGPGASQVEYLKGLIGKLAFVDKFMRERDRGMNRVEGEVHLVVVGIGGDATF